MNCNKFYKAFVTISLFMQLINTGIIYLNHITYSRILLEKPAIVSGDTT